MAADILQQQPKGIAGWSDITKERSQGRRTVERTIKNIITPNML